MEPEVLDPALIELLGDDGVLLGLDLLCELGLKFGD